MSRLSIALSVGATCIAAGLIALAAGCMEGTNTAAELSPGQFAMSVHFSPLGGCTDTVVEQINRATRSVEMQAYSFTSTPIAKALVQAHERGVAVTAILDKSQRTEKYSSSDFLLHANIPTYIDAKHAIAHNKIMLIDGTTIITGSFNFTNSAEKSNAENMLVIKNDPSLYAQYEENFHKHLDHSEQYAGRGEESSEPRSTHPSRKRSKGPSASLSVPLR